MAAMAPWQCRQWFTGQFSGGTGQEAAGTVGGASHRLHLQVVLEEGRVLPWVVVAHVLRWVAGQVVHARQWVDHARSLRRADLEAAVEAASVEVLAVVLEAAGAVALVAGQEAASGEVPGAAALAGGDGKFSCCGL